MGVHRVGLTITTVRFWALMWLPLVLPALSRLPAPTDVSLLNNINQSSFILKWKPGSPTPSGTYYRVSVGTERSPSDTPVSGCQHVQPPLICDMSEAFSDLKETYITTVTAHHGSRDSEPAIQRFKPLDHLELPEMTVKPCGRDLCVDFKHVGHPREANDLSYQLLIKATDKNGTQFLKDIRSLRRETLKDLAPGRRYCVSVRFADKLEKKKSNFSQPVCVFTAGFFPTDPVISAAVCSLVIAAGVGVVLLVCTGYIHLKKRQMPPVLSTIQHLDEVLIIVSHNASSFLNVWPAPPPAEQKTRKSSSSDESDEECTTESSGGTSNKAYLLASSSSLSCSSKLKVVSSSSSNPLPDVSDSQSGARFPPEGVEAVGLPGGQLQKDDSERDVMLEERPGQDVNLLTLTFGRLEEAELLEVDSLDGSEEIILVPPPQTAADWGVDQEEEETDMSSGYMGRPPAAV